MVYLLIQKYGSGLVRDKLGRIYNPRIILFKPILLELTQGRLILSDISLKVVKNKVSTKLQVKRREIQVFIWLFKMQIITKTYCLFKIYLLSSWKANPSQDKLLRSKKSPKFLTYKLKIHQRIKMKQTLKREESVRRRRNRRGGD